MKPTVKHFPILSTTKKAGVKPFICPKMYENETENAFKHTFKNGVSAVVVKASKFTMNKYLMQEWHKDIPNIQWNSPKKGYDFLMQYNTEFKGFIIVFFNPDKF